MKSTNDSNASADNRNKVPFAPSRGTKLLNTIAAALAETHGRSLAYEEIAQIAGLSTTTIFDWTVGANLRQVEALIRLLEQLPDSKWEQLVLNVCRQMPTIYHQKIAWHERQISNCQQLLNLEHGITWITGDENARDFLMTALGHSLARLNLPSSMMCGIDARLPDLFVPVAGIHYLASGLQPAKLQALAELAWSDIRSFKKGFVFLNGVWSSISEKHDEVCELATRCHVVIADQMNFAEAQSNPIVANATHLLTVTEGKDQRIKISIANPPRLSFVT